MDYMKLDQTEWVKEYLRPFFPGQPLTERQGEKGATVIIEVIDAKGYPKELQVAREFLTAYPKETIQNFFQAAGIAKLLQDNPTSAAIWPPNLGAPFAVHAR
jgi:hypothetical protein